MKTLLSLLLALIIFSGKAQDLRSDPTCATKKVGRYVIELAGCTNYIDIYLYNLKNEALRNQEIRGWAEFFYLDETFASSNFIQYNLTNSLRAEIPGPGFYNFKVNLIIGNDTIFTYFDNFCDNRAETKK